MRTYDLGDGVPLEYLVVDPVTRCRVDPATAPTLVLTAPDTTNPAVAVEHTGVGVYEYTPVPNQVGDWSYQWTLTGDITDTAYGRFRVVDPATENVVALAEVKAYLGVNSYGDNDIQDAIDAESEAQAQACRVPDPMPRDLRQALKRRVARNLAMRPIPLAILRGDSDAGDTTLPGTDPEIQRLEKPYRWLLVA